jgi:hypothetical protein
MAIVILALVFRTQLKALLSRPLQRVKAGPFEAAWLEVSSGVEAQVGIPRQLLPFEDPNVDIDVANVGAGPTKRELGNVAQHDPARAIFEGHERVFRRLQEITGRDEGRPPLPHTAASLGRIAAERGLIQPQTLRAIEGITQLRNLAAHAGDRAVSVEQAGDFLTYVDAVLYVLNGVPNAEDVG